MKYRTRAKIVAECSAKWSVSGPKCEKNCGGRYNFQKKYLPLWVIMGEVCPRRSARGPLLKGFGRKW